MPIRSQQELSNEYLVEKTGVDPALKVRSLFMLRDSIFTDPPPSLHLRIAKPRRARRRAISHGRQALRKDAPVVLVVLAAGGSLAPSINGWPHVSRGHTYTHIFFTKQIFVFFFVARKLFLSPTLMARVWAVSQRSEVPSRFLVWQRRFLILRLNHVLVGQAKPKRTSVH